MKWTKAKHSSTEEFIDLIIIIIIIIIITRMIIVILIILEIFAPELSPLPGNLDSLALYGPKVTLNGLKIVL